MQRTDHAASVRLSLASYVECRTVVNRCAYDGQAHGGVDTVLNAQHLDGAVALVVIHGYDKVKVTPDGAEKQRVCRQRARHIIPLGHGLRHCGSDLDRLLAVTEQAVLAGMRIDRADADARLPA